MKNFESIYSTDCPAEVDPARWNKLKPVQKLYYNGLAWLEEYDANIRDGRENSPADRDTRDRVITALYEAIKYYGINLAFSKVTGYRLPNDYRLDLENAILEAFMVNLMGYDPLRAAPTTYYKPYFKQAISQYLYQFSQHLSQYDSHNVGIVKAARQGFEKEGVHPDLKMLSEATGLSVKVVKNTLRIEDSSVQVDVEDHLNTFKTETTPTEALAQKELIKTLNEVMIIDLNDTEREMLVYWLGEADKKRTYKDVAAHFSTTVKTVKKVLGDACARLACDPALSMYRQHKPEPDFDVALEPASDSEALIMAFTSFQIAYSNALAQEGREAILQEVNLNVFTC